jgi:hypothetical protein
MNVLFLDVDKDSGNVTVYVTIFLIVMKIFLLTQSSVK